MDSAEERIAEVRLNPKTKQVKKIRLYQSNIRFKCQRCATFCCKLGGPELTEKDVKRIKKAGYNVSDFLDHSPKFRKLVTHEGNLRNKADGSCVFLIFDSVKRVGECLIYEARPALCRLYPFDLQSQDSRSFTLSLVPCCRGINVSDGELVDEEFIVKHLVEAVHDLQS